MTDPTCSAVSQAHAEPMRATASIVRNWLLIEQPGAWGPDALRQSGLPDTVAGALADRARDHSVRILLLRRPERPADGTHHFFAAHTGRHRRWIEEGAVSDPSDLLDLDLAALGAGRPPGLGRPRAGPLYLVCTNGRHDPCCANLGRPLARALQEGPAAGSTWECSHFGGDRFAGNLVCLPHGLYFGRVGPADADRVVAAYERGVIELAHYRGRAGMPFAAQAAEWFVRSEEALVGVDDLTWRSHRHLSESVVEVVLDARTGPGYRVKVGVERAAELRPLSCHGPHDQRPPAYSLLEVNRR